MKKSLFLIILSLFLAVGFACSSSQESSSSSWSKRQSRSPSVSSSVQASESSILSSEFSSFTSQSLASENSQTQTATSSIVESSSSITSSATSSTEESLTTQTTQTTQTATSQSSSSISSSSQVASTTEVSSSEASSISSSLTSSSSLPTTIGETEAVEEVLDAFALSQTVVAGGEVTLNKQEQVLDKTVSLTYEVISGQDHCSFVEEKIFFSNPRENKEVKVKVTATCGGASKTKEITLEVQPESEDIKIETFEAGTVDSAGANYTGGQVLAKRANSATTLSIVEYKNSDALLALCAQDKPYGAYVGFYLEVEANSIYKFSLDLDAVGKSTADLSTSEYIVFEAYQNSNMGVMSNRLTLYSLKGKYLSNSQKLSSLLEGNGRYNLLLETTQDGFVYLAIRVTNSIQEELNLYIDNLQVQKCRTDLSENFEYGKEQGEEFKGRLQAKVQNATIALAEKTSKAVSANINSGIEGYLGVKLKVEKGRTYRTAFECEVVGQGGTSYNEGIYSGDSATVMVLSNTEDLTSQTARLNFYTRTENMLNNAVLPNFWIAENRYFVTFTAEENGFVYLTIRTNQINEKTTVYVDNLSIIDLTKEIYDHNGMGYLNGLGEPLKNSNVQDFEQDKVIELMQSIGVKSTRVWFGNEMFKNWSWTTPLDTYELDPYIVAGYTEIINMQYNAGIKEITGMGWFAPVTASSTSTTGNEHFVPLPQDGEDYQIFLDAIYEIWYEMAKAFPQINIWEVGNETNNVDFIRHKTYHYLSYKDMARVTTDIQYYARKGIKQANPKAIILTPGLAPVSTVYNANTSVAGENITTFNAGMESVEVFFKYMYGNIASGEFPYHNNSKYVFAYDNNPDNYFDGLAWHPYDLGTLGYANTIDPYPDSFDINLWIDANNACYKVMCDYGDADKGVWFTEFGVSTRERNLVYSPVSHGSPYEFNIYFAGGTVYYTPDGKEENIVKQRIPAGNYFVNYYDYENYKVYQENYINAYYEAMNSDQMNYLHACHYFRMFGNEIDYTWNGLSGTHSGIFFESNEDLNRGLYPNHKAYILQEIYGGEGDLMKYATYSSVHAGDKQVGSGFTETFDSGKTTNLSGNTVKYKGDMYIYSSNNNGAFLLDNGVLTVVSENDAYIAFKINGFEKGKIYTVSFEISSVVATKSTTAFCVYASDIKGGVWDSSQRIPVSGTSTSPIPLKNLTQSGNKYSFTFTSENDYDSLYFTIRNSGTVVFESVSVAVNA